MSHSDSAHFNLVEALVLAKKISPGCMYVSAIHHNTVHQTYESLSDVEASDEPAQAYKDCKEAIAISITMNRVQCC